MLKMYGTAQQSAMFADQHRTERMPFCPSMPAMSMGMAAAAISTLIGTGVVTSVSLFVVVVLLLGLLLVVLISLLLTCLTGLIRLESRVGLTEELATTHARGE